MKVLFFGFFFPQLKADKEQHAIFSVFDENKSWYQDFNINGSIDRYKILKTDPEFYRSNVKHSKFCYK